MVNANDDADLISRRSQVIKQDILEHESAGANVRKPIRE